MSVSPLIASLVISPPGSPPIPSKRRRTELSEQPELQCAHPDKCHTAMDPTHSAHHNHHDHTHQQPHSHSNESSPSTALHKAIRAVQQDRSLSDAARAERIHLLFAEARHRALNRNDSLPSAQDSGQFPGQGASKGCEHYSRNCWIRAKCCGKYFPCRRCHDENEDHEIDRHATEQVGCVECGDYNQPVARNCRTCNVEFAKYFCEKCKFFDDADGKDIYHCDGCGICRVGKGLGIDQHHCNGCGNCVPIDTKESHPCRERSLDANCPICTHYLATSTDPVVFMRCGHTMHTECLMQHAANGYTCPICNKCLTDMSEWYREMDERIAKDIIPPEYANRVSRVLCHDCGEKTVVPFHFKYHKCACCDGYNTRILEQFDIDGGYNARRLADMNRGYGTATGRDVNPNLIGDTLGMGRREQHAQLEEAT